jgi:hypothetical protein
MNTEQLLVDALRVLIFDPRHVAHLRVHDALALNQAIRAIATYECDILNDSTPESIRRRAQRLYGQLVVDQHVQS